MRSCRLFLNIMSESFAALKDKLREESKSYIINKEEMLRLTPQHDILRCDTLQMGPGSGPGRRGYPIP